jgi:hypothetical protein
MIMIFIMLIVVLWCFELKIPVEFGIWDVAWTLLQVTSHLVRAFDHVGIPDFIMVNHVIVLCTI